jgi:hypothetical protein
MKLIMLVPANKGKYFLKRTYYRLGFKRKSISYIPNDWYSGRAKYNLKKMVCFVRNGTTSFSAVHLKSYYNIRVLDFLFCFFILEVYVKGYLFLKNFVFKFI